jgi:hypothetical protein
MKNAVSAIYTETEMSSIGIRVGSGFVCAPGCPQGVDLGERMGWCRMCTCKAGWNGSEGSVNIHKPAFRQPRTFANPSVPDELALLVRDQRSYSSAHKDTVYRPFLAVHNMASVQWHSLPTEMKLAVVDSLGLEDAKTFAKVDRDAYTICVTVLFRVRTCPPPLPHCPALTILPDSRTEQLERPFAFSRLGPKKLPQTHPLPRRLHPHKTRSHSAGQQPPPRH